MTARKRAFIFGAGFSNPAGMPLATELLPLLSEECDLENMQEWLDGMRERLQWLAGDDPRPPDEFKMNIEEVFHLATFDIEAFRLRQQFCPVGRGDGPATPWNSAEHISFWLHHLEEILRDVLIQQENQADLTPICRWAAAVAESDSVLTFNYDTLVERALAETGVAWHHGTNRKGDRGIGVFKLHGSIDWIVAHRSDDRLSKLDLLFDKKNENGWDANTGHLEEDYRLWRCRTWEQLEKWLAGRDLQLVANEATPRTVGLAGLGAYKQPHQIPGLGLIWANGMRALYEADLGVIVGFSMSLFDAMAQTQFVEVARNRKAEGRPLKMIVVDPFLNEESMERFERVFRSVEFVKERHEDVDWTSF